MGIQTRNRVLSKGGSFFSQLVRGAQDTEGVGVRGEGAPRPTVVDNLNNNCVEGMDFYLLIVITIHLYIDIV